MLGYYLEYKNTISFIKYIFWIQVYTKKESSKAAISDHIKYAIKGLI